jgi:hypothetical protein
VVVVYYKALFLHPPAVTAENKVTLQSDGKDANWAYYFSQKLFFVQKRIRR